MSPSLGFLIYSLSLNGFSPCPCLFLSMGACVAEGSGSGVGRWLDFAGAGAGVAAAATGLVDGAAAGVFGTATGAGAGGGVAFLGFWFTGLGKALFRVVFAGISDSAFLSALSIVITLFLPYEGAAAPRVRGMYVLLFLHFAIARQKKRGRARAEMLSAVVVVVVGVIAMHGGALPPGDAQRASEVMRQGHQLAVALQSVPLEQRWVLRSDGVLLFRGTASWRQLLLEARVGRCRWRGCDEVVTTPYAASAGTPGAEPSETSLLRGSVHRGFCDLYELLRTDLEETLRSSDAPRVHTIAGHSLGGIFAILCALDLACPRFDDGHDAVRTAPPVVYTFGAPRVGDKLFARTVRARLPLVHRIANEHDVVTRLPPLCAHVGTVPRPLRFQRGSIFANHALEEYAKECARASG